jgi:two-component system, NtrC family, sensor kinase
MNMNKSRIALGLLVAAILITILGLLIYKTRSVDFDKYNEIISTLRQLKQVDAEWNVDVLKSKTGFNTNYDPVASPLPLVEALETALRDKTTEVWGESAGLKGMLDQYRKVMDEKITMIERFKSQNSILRNSSRFLPVAATEMIESVRASNLSLGAKGEVEELLNGVLTNTMTYNLTPDATLKEMVESRAATLKAKGESLPSELKERVDVFVAHSATILRQQEIGDKLLNQLATLPTAKKIDELSDTFQKQHEESLLGQQIYRQLLVGFSIFLLALLAFFGWRLAKSYRELNKSNVQLNKANAELKESQMALVQSEKMSALGQMVAGIAHEINTPLAYVKGTLSVLAEQFGPLRELAKHAYQFTQVVHAPTPDKQEVNRQYAHVSRLSAEVEEHKVMDELGTLLKDGLHGIDEISEIVVNLKNFSRLDRAKVTEFSVQDGLESTLMLAKNMLKNSVEIIKEYGAIPKISCSPSQINQVFLNIVTNAVHAMPEDRKGSAAITLRTAREGNDMVRIEIQDNGSGIPKDVLPKIFDPFYTTKEIGKGTGMGLSISYKIIQEHGGKILVDTEEGMGTVFSILLPVQAVQAARPENAAIEAELLAA